MDLGCARLQDQMVKDAVAPDFRSGAWYSHSEASLQTMVCISSRVERYFAVTKILETGSRALQHLRQGNEGAEVERGGHHPEGA